FISLIIGVLYDFKSLRIAPRHSGKSNANSCQVPHSLRGGFLIVSRMTCRGTAISARGQRSSESLRLFLVHRVPPPNQDDSVLVMGLLDGDVLVHHVV